MNKKFIAILLVIIVVITAALACTSCSTGIFEISEERDYNQVIANVTYKDLSKNILKGELNSYVQSYGSYFQANYGMGVDDIVEYFYNSLTKSALFTLYSKYYIFDNVNEFPGVNIKSDSKIKDLKSKDFITLQEYVYCVDKANADFFSSYESLVEDYKKLEENKKDDEEEENKKDDEEDLLDPRSVRSYDDETVNEFDEDAIAVCVAILMKEDGYKYQNLKYKDITEDFIKNELKFESVDEFIKKIEVVNLIQAKIDVETDSSVKKNMKSAYNDFKKNLDKAFIKYDKFVTDQVESCIITKMKKDMEKKSQVENIEAKLASIYNDLKEDSIKAYKDNSSFSSAVENGTFVLTAPSNEYATVKSILLKFSDNQTSIVSMLKNVYGIDTPEFNKALIDLAIGRDTELSKQIAISSKDLGINVNVSNPYYDSSVDEKKDAYTDKDVSSIVILYAMANSIESITQTIKTKFTTENPSATAQEIAVVEKNARIEAFTQWMYLVNDDSGMFDSDFYVVTPGSEKSSFVKQYTAHARLLVKEDVGAVMAQIEAADVSLMAGDIVDKMKDKDDALIIFKNPLLNVTGNYDITLKEVVGVKDSNKVMNGQYIATLTTAEGNSISFDVNEYGIHIIMITSKPGCEETTSAETIEDKTYYVQSDIAIREENCSIKYGFVYNKVEGSYVANTEYFVWKGGEFVSAKFDEENPAFKDGVIYFTREWQLKSVSIDIKTVKDFLKSQLENYIYTDSYSVEQTKLYLSEKDGVKGIDIEKKDKVYDELLKDLKK